MLDDLKDMLDAFGGEFWQDGTLCFKHGMDVSQPFKLLPGVGEEYDRKEEEKIASYSKRNWRREKRRLGEPYSVG